MQTIKALSLTKNVKDWLANVRQPRVLHVFDNACNLLNEQKEILSIVTQQIGNGPFNLVIEDKLYSEQFSIESIVNVSSTQLIVGDLSINTADTKLWNPRPDWDRLHAKRADILDQILSLQADSNKRSNQSFSDSLASANISTVTKLTSQLAGLGQGLTPAGDDFIMGALYGTWIIHPSDVALKLGNEIAETAAPLTTSLSTAWIRSAGKGEAGEVWHHLFDAIIARDETNMRLHINGILAVGETSGADALAGFIGVCSAAKERMYN